MGKVNTITKDYMSNPKYFADSFNYYLFDGKQVIKASNLQMLDPTEMAIIPKEASDSPKVYGLMKILRDPVELIDPSNIKVATNKDGVALYISRAPIPHPYKTILFEYKKAIGVECWNKASLELFVTSEPGVMETIEDLVALRFFENGCPMHYTLVESNSLSVDTPKDLEKVRLLMKDILDKQ